MNTKQILESLDNAHVALLGRYIKNAPSQLRIARDSIEHKLNLHDTLVFALKRARSGDLSLIDAALSAADALTVKRKGN